MYRSHVYCEGRLQETVQTSGLYKDSKTFVDMPMKKDPDEILKRFEALPDHPDQETVRLFVEENFGPPGSDTEYVKPEDWRESPKFLNDIKNPEIRLWASHLNNVWRSLFKRTIPDVAIHPQRYSLLPLPHSFLIPGGRFREMFYWDTYWGIKGLLLCQMSWSVKGILRNYVSLINRFSYVPNGCRVYLLERSQPPLLASMVEDYIIATGDNQFLDEVLPALEQEYVFWTEYRGINIAKNGETFRLQRYQGSVSKPRPESFKEDQSIFLKAEEKRYSELRAACESGWDFSSRWLRRSGPNKMSLAGIRTSQIVPVDLNSIMYMMESSLANLYKIVGNTDRRTYFDQQATLRAKAIEAIFWDDHYGCWFDYDLEDNIPRQYFYGSAGFPMFAGCHGTTLSSKAQKEARFLKYLQSAGALSFPGGIPTSLDSTDQQWDFPNAWPPLMHVIILGLAQSGHHALQNAALDLAQKWLRSNYRTWKKSGDMFEKYDVQRTSAPGGGGEYDVQVSRCCHRVCDNLGFFGTPASYSLLRTFTPVDAVRCCSTTAGHGRKQAGRFRAGINRTFMSGKCNVSGKSRSTSLRSVSQYLSLLIQTRNQTSLMRPNYWETL
ncbi:trehalase-like isoform X2 [Liolophura sinensis]|uniref:trehalase-like isoform X2 n=1 Tax=Liolophura sinensis TaxID=3198878 RepID=UPI003158C124